jgi:hypothetical protein
MLLMEQIFKRKGNKKKEQKRSKYGKINKELPATRNGMMYFLGF